MVTGIQDLGPTDSCLAGTGGCFTGVEATGGMWLSTHFQPVQRLKWMELYIHFIVYAGITLLIFRHSVPFSVVTLALVLSTINKAICFQLHEFMTCALHKCEMSVSHLCCRI